MKYEPEETTAPVEQQKLSSSRCRSSKRSKLYRRKLKKGGKFRSGQEIAKAGRQLGQCVDVFEA
jgi:hypothetical protein